MATYPKLPDSFDIIVCGTGLTESMVAASLSRAGKKVLHIDRNDYYGSQWATFTFESFLTWIERHQEQQENQGDVLSQEKIPLMDSCIRNIVVQKTIADKSENQDSADSGSIFVTSNDKQGKLDTVVDESEENLVPDDHVDVENSSEIVKTDSEVVSSTDSGVIDTTEGENNTARKEKERSASISNQNDILNNENLKSKPPLSMVSQAKIKQNSKDISLEDFKVLSRKFNLDVTPKFLFSAGPLVKSIIKANITHYMEFKVVNRILTLKDDQIIEVPCNRADVFSSNFLSMIEKRMLMKFMTFCLEPNSEEDTSPFKGKPFKEFLESRRLSENLQKFIIYSIAMVKPDTATEVALKETHRFLVSLGRYGKSPFIWPLYGVGELPQAFCRMSAVFGGTYCLKMNLQAIETFNESDKISISMDGEKIECEHLVMDSSYVPLKYSPKTSRMVSRAILITNSSLLPAVEEYLSFLTIPPFLGKEESVRVIELGPASSACPNGLYVLYLSCNSSCPSAEEDLMEYATMLTVRQEKEFETKPRLLWSIYFNQLDDISFENVPKNVCITSMPDSSLGYDRAVEEAETIFHKICPDEEFMLAVPNAEDIIWGNDESEKTDDKHVECDSDNNAEKNNECNNGESNSQEFPSTDFNGEVCEKSEIEDSVITPNLNNE